MKPATLPLRVDRGKAVRRTILVRGLDLTAASYRGQVRAYPDAPGDPIIDLPKVTNDDNGIRLMEVVTIDGLPTSVLRLQVSVATMSSSAIPEPGRAGEPGVPESAFWLGNWDMDITPTGGIEEVYARGPFRVEGVVTQ